MKDGKCVRDFHSSFSAQAHFIATACSRLAVERLMSCGYRAAGTWCGERGWIHADGADKRAEALERQRAKARCSSRGSSYRRSVRKTASSRIHHRAPSSGRCRSRWHRAAKCLLILWFRLAAMETCP
eukprot:974108-Pleurochrysis_carterae.AAC.4